MKLKLLVLDLFWESGGQMKKHNEARGCGSIVEESGEVCGEILSESFGVAEV